MKNKYIIIFIMLNFFCFSNTVTILSDTWMPYNGISGETMEGYGIEIARKILEKNGYELVYENRPWSRAIIEVRNGSANAVIGALVEDAPDFLFPKEEIGVVQQTFFVDRDSLWKYDGVESLRNGALGIIQDYSYGEELDAYIETNKSNFDRIQSSTGENALYQNARKLEVDRIKYIIEDKMVFNYTINLLNEFKGLFKEAGHFEEENIYIAFSPNRNDSKKLASIISEGIKEMRKTGELDKILKKYGLEDWK